MQSGITQQTLTRRLNESGLLLRTDTGRATYPITLEGVRRRVLVFARSFLHGKAGQSGQPGQPSDDTGETVPVSCPDFPTAATESGHETGTKSADRVATVPAVPTVPVSCAREGQSRVDDLAEQRDCPRDDVEVYTP